MTFLILLLLLAAGLIAASIHLLRHDGRGQHHPPASHCEDGRFLPPGQLGCNVVR